MNTTCRLVIVDGLAKCGKTALAEAIAADLGVPLRFGTFGWLDAEGPLVVDEFHLTQAMRMATGSSDMTVQAWAFLDELAARRFARIIFLVDTPLSAYDRAMCERHPDDDVSPGCFGKELQALNTAFSASSVARKGSYRLTQFMDPATGEKTAMYCLLIETLRKEMNL